MDLPQPSLAFICEYRGPRYPTSVGELNYLFDRLLGELKKANELINFLESVGAKIGVKTNVKVDCRTVDEHECRAVLFVQMESGSSFAVSLPGPERSAAIYSLTDCAESQELFARLLVEVVKAKFPLG